MEKYESCIENARLFNHISAGHLLKGKGQHVLNTNISVRVSSMTFMGLDITELN